MTAFAGSLIVLAGIAAWLGLRSATEGVVVSRLPVGDAASPRVALLDRLGRSRLGRRLDAPRARATLTTAGWAIGPEAFAGARLAAACGGAAVGAVMPSALRPLLVPMLAGAAVRLPMMMAARAARRRVAAIDAEVPQLLDLMAAGSSAGLSAPLALRRAVPGLRGPIVEEFTKVLDAVDLGSRWRRELTMLAERLGLPDLRRAVSALTRTETLGSSLAEATSEVAASVRQARRAAVTERARTAPVKMLFPLVFLVLPAFLLLTVVPVLLTTVQSIR